MSNWISGLSIDTVQYQISSLKTALIKLDEAHKALEDDVSNNTSSILDLATDVSNNTSSISDLATDVSNNTSSISDLATDVSNNTSSIATNQTSIGTNTSSIATLQALINQAENADNQILTVLFNNDSDLIQLLYDDQAATYTISLRKQDGTYTTIQDIIDAINGLVDSVNNISDPEDEANLGDIVDTADSAFDIFSGLGDFASAGAGFVGGLIASSLNTSKADGLFLLNWINVLRLAIGTVINLLETEIIHRLHQDRAIKIYSRNTIDGTQLNLADGEAYVYDSTYRIDVEGNPTTELDSRAITFQGEEILTLGNELTETELNEYVFGNTIETITEPDGTITTNVILRDYKNIFKGKTKFLDDVVLPNYYDKTYIDTSNYTKDEVDALIDAYSGNLSITSTISLSASTGDYGSVQINGSGTGNWQGYSIDGRVVFMHDGADTWGIYDDVNNRWRYRNNMSVDLDEAKNNTWIESKSLVIQNSLGTPSDERENRKTNLAFHLHTTSTWAAGYNTETITKGATYASISILGGDKANEYQGFSGTGMSGYGALVKEREVIKIYPYGHNQFFKNIPVDVDFAANINCANNLSVTGTSTLTGAVTCGGNLTVTGTSTLTGNVTCSGNLTVNGNLVATDYADDLDVTGTLSVTGTSTLTGAVTCSSSLSCGAVSCSSVSSSGAVSCSSVSSSGAVSCSSVSSSGAINCSGGTLSGDISIGRVISNSVCRRTTVTFTTQSANYNVHNLNFRDYVNKSTSSGDDVWIFRITSYQAAGDFGDANVHSSCYMFYESTYAGGKSRKHVIYENDGHGAFWNSSTNGTTIYFNGQVSRTISCVIESIT